MIGTGQRVDQHHERIIAARVFHIADGVRRIDIDIIGNLRLLGITGRMQLIARRGSEIPIVAQDCVNHIHTRLGINAFNENRFGGKMPIDPPFEACGILVDVVVDH